MRSIDQRIQRFEPLAARTTLRLGGTAEYFLSVADRSDLVPALSWAAERGLEATVLGGGSNVVVADEGVPGLVLHLDLRGIEATETDDGVLLRAAAGESWDGLVRRAVDRGWAGVECLSGIPGSVGATPIQNVGAYGQEVSQVITWVEALDRQSGVVHRLEAEACGFGYRTSRFKTSEVDRWVVLEVEFRLRPGGPPQLVYPELRERFETSEGGGEPSLLAVREAVLALRRGKGMVLDAGDPDTRSAGSFFVNPVLDSAQHEDLLARCRVAGLPAPPVFGVEGGSKVPAAWLVERAGFGKGFRRGAVGVSSKHCLALVHHGGGTTRDLLALMSEIRQSVGQQFGVTLQPEPRFLGAVEVP